MFVYHFDRACLFFYCVLFYSLYCHQNLEQRRVRTVLIEYVLIADVNDSDETAHELGALLKDRAIVLNVIP
jgi:adenine C2-methylase RlmN of 23S rRNA A2503 and tRNA A37